MSASPLERLGPYVIEGELGRGGMGVVVRARDPSGRPVAIKRMLVRDAQLAQRLLREGDVRIDHPHVVKVLAAGLDERGDPYVVTELLEGEDLADRSARGLPLPGLLELVAQAADGLAAIHAAGVVHRDLKPSNLFVCRADHPSTAGDGPPRETVKVLDFGIARFGDLAGLGTVTGLTATGSLLGTPAYLAPEQARGVPDVDGRVDVWALGMTLFQLLSGTLPFQRHSAIATALAVQLEPLPSLGRLCPQLPFELIQLVERCLARAPDDRVQRASELAEALRQIPAGTSRLSQPLVHATSETWRHVALIVVAGIDVEADLRPRAERAEATLVPTLGQAAAIVFGADAASGDELERAIAFAIELADHCQVAVVGAGRVKSQTKEIDSDELAPLFTLLAEVGEGVALSAEAASLAPSELKLEVRADGSAKVVGRADGPSGEARFCVGREEELGAIEAHCVGAREGGPSRLVIEGPAGAGKSTLLRAAQARGGASIFIDARLDPGEPLGPFFRALALSAPSTERIEAALDARRVAVIDALGERLSELEAHGDRDAERRRETDGVERPLVVFVDDADRLDGPGLALLDDLPLVFEGRPLAIVTTERAPASPSTTSTVAPTLAADDPRPGPPRIVLHPLSIPVVRALLTARYGAMLESRRIGEIAERAGGNPLFAEQLARAAASQGGGDWGLPLTIESAVQAQLDHLSPELVRAVYSLAVVGFEGDAISVRAALGGQAGGLVAALEERGVLRRIAGGFRFKYRVAQEVAYAAIDDAERVRLHGELARRLAEARDVSPDRVLEHAEAGRDEVLTARFALEAFFRAANLGDGPRALLLIDRARASTDAPFQCLFLAAQAAAFVRSSESEPLLAAALEAARTDHERALCRIELAEHRRRAGDREAARTLLRMARESVEGEGASEVAARARCREALLSVSEGSIDGANDALATYRSAPSAGSDGGADTVDLAALPTAIRALVWDTRGYVAGASNDLGARLEAYSRAASLYAECGDVRRHAGASANLGDTQRVIGDDGAAEKTLRRAIEGARKVGNTLTEAYALTNLGAVLRHRGRLREAGLMLETADARARTVGDLRLQRMIALYRAQVQGRDVEDDTLRETAADPTLHAAALTLRLTHGTPSAAQLDAAEALLSSSDVEQGVLELGGALYRRRSTPEVRALVLSSLERALVTLSGESRAIYAASARAALGELGEPTAPIG